MSGVCRSTVYNIHYTVVFQEKIDALKVLGADVRPVPAVPFDNPDNYNHQVCVHSPTYIHNMYVCVSWYVS